MSALRENGPSRFKLITSSKIFVYIYEVFSIAPRCCLYRKIERTAKFPKESIVRAVIQFVF